MQKAEDNIPRLCSVLDLHHVTLFQSATLCSCLIIACTHANDGVLVALIIMQSRKHVSHIYSAELFKLFEWHIHHSSLVRKVVHLPTFHRPNHFQLAHSELLVLLQDFHVTYHFFNRTFPFVLLIQHIVVYTPACLASSSSIALTSVIAITSFLHTLYYIILFSFWQIIPKFFNIFGNTTAKFIFLCFIYFMLLCIFTKRRTTWLPQCSFHVALLLKCSCKLHLFTFCQRNKLPIQGYLPEAVNLLPKTGFFAIFRLLGWNPAGFHLAIHGKK